MKVCIAGSRSIKEIELVEEAIAESGYDITTVISGCAWGVDKLGEAWAEKNGIPVDRHPAAWDDLSHPKAVVKYGMNGKPYNALAGHIRNEEMARIADAVIIVWDGQSSGSKNMYDIAGQYGIPRYRKTVNINKYLKEKRTRLQLAIVEWARELRKDQDAVVIDTESCGGSKNDEIISIAVVRLHNGEPLLNTLLKPKSDVKFNWYASQVHGITEAKLINAPQLPDIWDELHNLLHKRNVLAYNNSADRRMLEQTAIKHGLQVPEISWHCIMNAYKRFTLRTANTNLTTACNEMRVKAGTHDALDDALAAARLVYRMEQNFRVS